MKARAALRWALAVLAPLALATGFAYAQDDYGKPGGPVKLTVGYQPYYTQSWSGVVMRGKKFYEKYLPPGSQIEFQIGLQGAIIVNNMLAGKQSIGYMGDMPAIVSTTKTETADIRLVAGSRSTSATSSSRGTTRRSSARPKISSSGSTARRSRCRRAAAPTASRRRRSRRRA